MADRIGSAVWSQISREERENRSRCLQLLRDSGLLRGSLLVRERRCGKPTCHCVSGERHKSLVVQFKVEGRTRQIHVPADMEVDVRRWVEQYGEIQRRIESISESWQAKIAKSKAEAKKARKKKGG